MRFNWLTVIFMPLSVIILMNWALLLLALSAFLFIFHTTWIFLFDFVFFFWLCGKLYTWNAHYTLNLINALLLFSLSHAWLSKIGNFGFSRHHASHHSLELGQCQALTLKSMQRIIIHAFTLSFFNCKDLWILIFVQLC